MSTDEPKPALDVDALVADLQARAAERSASGAYDAALGVPFETGQSGVQLRPWIGRSTRPVVGPALSFTKRGLMRLQQPVLIDLASQVSSALARQQARLDAESVRRAELEEQVAELTDRVAKLEADRGHTAD